MLFVAKLSFRNMRFEHCDAIMRVQNTSGNLSYINYTHKYLENMAPMMYAHMSDKCMLPVGTVVLQHSGVPGTQYM